MSGEQGSNSVRPKARILVAFRDGGICGYCGLPIVEAGKKRQIKIFDFDTEKSRKGATISGDSFPAIDHLWSEFFSRNGNEKQVDTTPGKNRVKYRNLSLVHKGCNTQKAEDGGTPTERQQEQAEKWIDVDKCTAAMIEAGFSPLILTADDDRAEGRAIFREFAAHLGQSKAPKKAPKTKPTKSKKSSF